MSGTEEAKHGWWKIVCQSLRPGWNLTLGIWWEEWNIMWRVKYSSSEIFCCVCLSSLSVSMRLSVSFSFCFFSFHTPYLSLHWLLSSSFSLSFFFFCFQLSIHVSVTAVRNARLFRGFSQKQGNDRQMSKVQRLESFYPLVTFVMV